MPTLKGSRSRSSGNGTSSAGDSACLPKKPARRLFAFRNFQLFDAPHVAIIHSEAKLGPYGALDCGGFVSAFMLAAASLGVASIAQASVASFPAVIRSHFDLPQNRMVLCAISFGFEDPGHPANGFRTERASLNEVMDLRL